MQEAELLTTDNGRSAVRPRAARWRTLPIVLVVVMLLGSVLVPARETWRIMHLLRETTDVIEPARLFGARLEFGLTVESAALEAYALSGDSLQLTRYRAAAAEDDRRVAGMEQLASRLDAEAIDRAVALRSRLTEWRDVSRGLVDTRLDRSQLAVVMRAQRASYERTLRDVARLTSYLAAEGSARRELIQRSERLGLVVNASLVLIALAAVFAVTALSHRERRLTMILKRRIEEEAALRNVARAIGVAATTEEVIRQIAEGATAATRAAGVYVECIAHDDDATPLVEAARHERGRPAAQYTRRALAGSFTQAIMTRCNAGSLIEAESVTGWMTPDLFDEDGESRAGLLAPLASGDHTFGVLVVLRDRASTAFSEDTRRQVHTLADLAIAALQRVSMQAAERRALKEARRRADQEAALREAAEALAAAFTIDDVTRQIARTALNATRARGAFVEEIVHGAEERSDVVVVRASAGTGVPALGTKAAYGGSYAETVIAGGEAVLVPDLTCADRVCTISAVEDARCSAIVVPLRRAAVPVGALFVLSEPGSEFRPDDLARADTFGHLAVLAYEKVGLLDEAREGRAELERVMKSRSRLMRGFSHDVKNPLGAADGYAELLTGGIYGALSAEQTKHVECIRRSIRVALALIDDLHQLARAETGHLELSLTLVDLADLVRASGEEYRAAAEASGLSLSVELPPGSLVAKTDRARVRQVLGNLLSNAIKYTAQGSITVGARPWPDHHRAADDDGWIIIDVADTGRGIPVEKRDAIFEEFIRLDAGEVPGAGLGLAISQRLARALGGQITVRSEVARGSTFSLWIPLESRDGSAATAAASGARRTPLRDRRLTGRTIGHP
jgi:signal transduction histidine kinase/GAF domain-containing protein